MALTVDARPAAVGPAREGCWPHDQGKAALTELFQEVRAEKTTPIIVERIVNDIDAIVRQVRFEGWQNTIGGERQVKQALRATLPKDKLHKDQDRFDRAYGYIEQYY